LNRRWARVGPQKQLVEKYPIAFAVVSPACVVIHGVPTGRIGGRFGRFAKVMARAEPVRVRWHDGGEIAAKPRLNIMESLDFRESVLARSRFSRREFVRWTNASACGGQLQIWKNNLFEFSMIPGLPDYRNPS
jgi:hypothetical protein